MPDPKRSAAAKKAAATRRKNAKANAKPKPKRKPQAKGSRRKTSGPKTPGNESKNGLTPVAIPKGRHLTVAEKNLRDSLIMQRKAQGWSWDEIAEEAGISPSQCKRAHANRKRALPPSLDMDPLDLLRSIIDGFQSSIGDFEHMALGYAERHPSAAVGAKKAANDARWRMTVLLQAIGIFPRELGTMRHVVEVRETAQKFLDLFDRLDAGVTAARGLPAEEQAAALEKATEQARESLDDIVGTGREVPSGGA